MIRQCDHHDLEWIWDIINDGAQAYKGIIPQDCWKEPYIGARLLSYLRAPVTGPVLIGTWADAVWAIHFYEKNGFQMVPPELKDKLLTKYWTISNRQAETSVVLANAKWIERQ